jgi:hypothetical protein
MRITSQSCRKHKGLFLRGENRAENMVLGARVDKVTDCRRRVVEILKIYFHSLCAGRKLFSVCTNGIGTRYAWCVRAVVIRTVST